MFKVAVLGAACSQFGELWATSPRQLVAKTVESALTNAGLTIKDIEAVFVGNMLSGILGNQENLGALFAEELGLTTAAFKIEGACASGGLALHNAFLAVKSGLYQKVLVVGVEKMTDHQPAEISLALMGAGHAQERAAGLTFPGLYALIARFYLNHYRFGEEDLAWVAVKNHFHASLNPKAHFPYPVTVEQVLKSPYITDPLKLLDCSPISDGAACLVLVNQAIAQKQKKVKPVWLRASSVATDTLSLAKRKTLTSFSAAVAAARCAYQQAGLRPEDIDVAEVHDCFSIAEVIALEDLGFYPKGKAILALKKGELTLGQAKKLVVNTSGGLKAGGHPVGATGVKQAVEVVQQLRGEAGSRSVKGAKIGLTHNVGGAGAVAAVHIFSL